MLLGGTSLPSVSTASTLEISACSAAALAQVFRKHPAQCILLPTLAPSWPDQCHHTLHQRRTCAAIFCSCARLTVQHVSLLPTLDPLNLMAAPLPASAPHLCCHLLQLRSPDCSAHIPIANLGPPEAHGRPPVTHISAAPVLPSSAAARGWLGPSG
jgi:hypothetical protein